MVIAGIHTPAMFAVLCGNRSVRNVKKVFVLARVECPAGQFGPVGAFSGGMVGGSKSRVAKNNLQQRYYKMITLHNSADVAICKSF
jgi:hypothetical protein